MKADITDAKGDERRARGGPDAVFHNASVVHTKQNKEDFVWKVNLDGTRHVLSACQKHSVPKMVYVSSGQRGLRRERHRER